MKMVIKHGYDEFFVHNSESCIGSYGPCNPSRTPKLWAITQENDNFLVIPRKHVSGLTVIVNRPGTPKLWSITHGNDHKKQKRRIFIIPLKYVNRLGTLILWEITHANGQKTLK
jgi:hypothetical protein